MILAASALVTKKDGDVEKVLVVTRKNNSALLALPGGKVDPEDFNSNFPRMMMTAAARELKEETGLTAYGDRHLIFTGIDDFDNYVGIVYVEFAHGDVVPEPGTSVFWVTWDELLAKGFAPKFYQKLRGI